MGLQRACVRLSVSVCVTVKRQLLHQYYQANAGLESNEKGPQAKFRLQTHKRGLRAKSAAVLVVAAVVAVVFGVNQRQKGPKPNENQAAAERELQEGALVCACASVVR